MFAIVGNAEEPSGVAGRCHTDLLLSLGGLWRSHCIFQLQWGEVTSNTPSLPRVNKVFCAMTYCFYFSVRNNCERDAVIVGVINSATSLYASISIFSILGFKATNAYNACRNEYVSANVLSLSWVFFPLANTNYNIFVSHLQKHLDSDQPLWHIRPEHYSW